MRKNTFKQSLGYALSGFWYALKSERNLKFHMFAAVLVSAAGAICGFSALEISLLLLVIGFVILAEMLNTAVEKMVDYISPQWSDNAKIAKDVAAGAVLVASFFAVIIGLVLFLRPHVLQRVFELIL